MSPQRAPSPARLLAPLALGTFVVALLLVVLASAGGDGDSEDGAGRSAIRERPAAPGRADNRRRPSRQASTYTVKPRDTLGSIAEKTGVEVETLQVLNPQLDPQALVAGQKIKLRE
jgi:hypothetical protein